jgi:uncharacterized protein (TIRG00374 family)
LVRANPRGNDQFKMILLRKPVHLIWLLLIPVILVAARILPWQAIVQTLLSLTVAELAILLVVNAVILLLFCTRWWLVLRAYGYPVPYFKLSGYRMAGFSISYFTPGTQFGGEPLQAYLVQSRHTVPTSTAMAAVSIDKLLELFTNFSFMALGILVVASYGLLPGFNRVDLAGWIGVLLLLPVVYFAILMTGRYPLGWALTRMPAGLWRKRWLEKLPVLILNTEREMSRLFRSKPLLVVWTLLISSIVWALMLFEYWLTVNFLGGRLTLLQAVGGYTAMRVSFLTPLPGGVGLLEGSQVLALTAFGYTTALGISMSLLIRARDFIVGIFGLWVGGMIGANMWKKSADRGVVLQVGSLEPEIVQTGDC